MTIRKRLAHSNIAMLVIPLLTAAVLVLLRGDIVALHDALEQVESLLHGFKALLAVYLTAMTLLVLLTVAATNVYLTRRLFRHISEPLDVLTAGVARIRGGDFETPIAYGGCDEFRPACDAVDEMAARLRGSTSAAIRPSLSRSRCPLQRRTDMDKILIIEDDPDIAAKDIPILMVTALARTPTRSTASASARTTTSKSPSRRASSSRAKANPAHPQLLQTVWGVGYRLRKDNEPS